MLLSPARAPFEGHPVVTVVPPEAPAGDPDGLLATLPALLIQDADALARELGAPIHLAPAPPEHGATWLIGPSNANPWIAQAGLAPPNRPVHHLDRARSLLVTDAPDTAGLVGAFAGLRSLARHPGGPLPFGHAQTLDEAVRRVAVEVPDTLPHLRERAPDWARLARTHALDVRSGHDPVGSLQRWLAVLGDLHTWVRPARPRPGLPYRAVVEGDVLRLVRVPPWSEGWRRGVRPGWRLTGLDVADALSRTPGPPHARVWMAARTLLSAPADTTLSLEARGDGRVLAWDEVVRWPEGPPVAWGWHDEEQAWLWIGGWFPELGVDEAVLEALEAVASADHLVVDLRGNAGGRLASAMAFRDRLLERPVRTGWQRTTGPGGRLGPWEPLDAAPANDGPRFAGKVSFLTDETTFSASERVMLGLPRDRFRRLGMPTGGGVGRVRRLPLLPGWRLTITMSEVVGPRGERVEGVGLAPHRRVGTVPEAHGEDRTMDAAWR